MPSCSLCQRVALASAIVVSFTSQPGFAHGIAGDRIFPATLNVDDPAVADELALPNVASTRSGVDANGNGPTQQTDVNATYAKRITDTFGVSVQLGHSFYDVANAKSRNGWQDLTVGAKYQAYVNAQHEILVSVGVSRELPHTGSAQAGADTVGHTTPTVYFGKGLGDLPVAALRPFAITGTAGYQISDKKPSSIDTTNGGYENRFVGGLTLQYSIPYLQSQVHHYDLPSWVDKLTPLVEVSYSSPVTRPSTQPMQLMISPGVVYSEDSWQFAVEALIPANRNTGTNVGVIAELHFFLDDIFPHSLGAPVVNWFH